MAGTVRTRSRLPHITLNSDGESHLLLNLTTIFVLLLGLVSFVLGLVIRNVPSADSKAMAILAAVTGLVAMVVGLFAQMISATREQRVLIVTGIIAAFVGLALGLGHGAFS
jgi:uncharacterized membrane protein